jgi:hypothetical protein
VSERRSRRRAVCLIALTGVLTGVLALGWLAVRVVQVRSHLLAARAGLSLAAGHLDATPPALTHMSESVRRELRAARAGVDDPIWRAAAAVPLAGRSFAAVRVATRVSSDLADSATTPVLQVLERIRDGGVLVAGRVDLALVGDVSTQLQPVASNLHRGSQRLGAVSRRWLPGPLARDLKQLDSQLAAADAGLQAADRGLIMAPGMLGAAGPRRYFLAVQNNAEVRGTGGLVGAYAVLRIDRGSISLDAVGTDRDFRTGTVPLADLGPDYAERYGTGGPTLWSAAGLSPDWPSAGTVMARLWEAQGGGHLDGVIGLDPRAIAGLLSVTGPVTVQGRRIASANVADFVMRDEYVESDVPQTERKDVLADLALALYQRVVAGGYDTVAMGRALGSAAAGGHLQVMSTNPVEQAVLQPMRVSGALPAAPGAFLDVVLNNAAGNKVDYYLRRKVSYVRTGSRAGRLTVTLTNTVDPRTVPPIVTGRLDKPTEPGDPGQTRLLLSLYVGVGDAVRSVTADGVALGANLGSERGHGVATVAVEVSPQHPTVVTADVTDQGGELTYRQQPLAVDDTLDLHVPFRLG